MSTRHRNAGKRPNHTPTPPEIRAACRKIQAGWSASEERQRRYFTNETSRSNRAGGRVTQREIEGLTGWTPPVVRWPTEEVGVERHPDGRDA